MRRILKDYSSVSLDESNFEGKIDFSIIFGRTGPLHIEVGSGKGTFLVNQARKEPQANFLGIEWAGRYYRYAVDRLGRWGIKNVRLIRTEAAGFIKNFVPAETVDCFHIYFPDPWPKKRHHKRRFICGENLKELLRCLKKSGTIRIATDHAGYFEQIRAVLADRQGIEQIDFLPTAGADEGEWVGTNFERKYLKGKRPIYTIAVRKL